MSKEIEAWIDQSKQTGEVRQLCERLGADRVVSEALAYAKQQKDQADAAAKLAQQKFEKVQKAIEAATKP